MFNNLENLIFHFLRFFFVLWEYFTIKLSKKKKSCHRSRRVRRRRNMNTRTAVRVHSFYRFLVSEYIKLVDLTQFWKKHTQKIMPRRSSERISYICHFYENTFQPFNLFLIHVRCVENSMQTCVNLMDLVYCIALLNKITHENRKPWASSQFNTRTHKPEKTWKKRDNDNDKFKQLPYGIRNTFLTISQTKSARDAAKRKSIAGPDREERKTCQLLYSFLFILSNWTINLLTFFAV